MLLCSVSDVQARISTDTTEAALGDLIEAVSDTIEEYMGLWLGPRPSNPTLTGTYLFDVERTASAIRLKQGGRQAGIRVLTSLGVSMSNQPDTGGTWTTVTPSTIMLRPRPYGDVAATTIALTTGMFWRGYNTVTATGSFGPASVAPMVRECAIQLVMLTLNFNPGLMSQTIGDWTETYAATSSVSGFVQERDALLSTIPGVAAL